MKFYAMLETALCSDAIDVKADACAQLLRYCSENDPGDQADAPPEIFTEPSYARRCRIVPPRELPQRKDFDTTEGLATLVHAITHIEYSAIDLALDAVYRFREMPLAFKVDWLVVAEDEVRHFKMLHGILEQLGHRYGDFPVHQGLFIASSNTREDVLDRMAVIPRHFEAGGLDANPQIVTKLESQRKNPIVREIIEALGVIHDEEIDHVRKGDKWFRWLCEQRGLDVESAFRSLLTSYNLHTHKHMNIAARKEAGFACSELLKLGAKKCE